MMFAESNLLNSMYFPVTIWLTVLAGIGENQDPRQTAAVTEDSWPRLRLWSHRWLALRPGLTRYLWWQAFQQPSVGGKMSAQKRKQQK